MGKEVKKVDFIGLMNEANSVYSDVKKLKNLEKSMMKSSEFMRDYQRKIMDISQNQQDSRRKFEMRFQELLKRLERDARSLNRTQQKRVNELMDKMGGGIATTPDEPKK